MLYRYQALGAAATNGTAVISVRALQQQLVRAGFDIGPTGVDGVWGPKTQTALHKAFNAAHLTGSDWAYTTARTTITLKVSAWTAIQALPAGVGGQAQSAPAAARGPLEPYDETTRIVPLEEAPNTMPWLLAGGALLAVGAYFYFKKKPVRSNRRRSRRRRRR